MKVSPVSGDLLVKLAIGAGIGLALWFVASRASRIVAAGVEAFPRVLDSVNPASTGNIVYGAVNGTAGAVAGREFSIGADVRDAAEGALGSSGFFVIDAISYPINAAIRAIRQ